MRAFMFAALVPIIAAPAVAQEALYKRVQGCAAIETAGERHACFDALVPELKAAGEMRFGAHGGGKPSALIAPVTNGDAAKADNSPVAHDPDSINVAVVSMTRSSDGKLRFTMQNGQIWRQIDTTTLRNVGEAPWIAEIRKASFGSFLLSLNGGRAVRVERVN